MTELEGLSLASKSGAGVWNVWWREAPERLGPHAEVQFRIHSEVSSLCAWLEAHPEEGLAFHESTTAIDAEHILQESSRRGWMGRWAALSGWLRQYRWFHQIFRPPLEIASWPSFWADPWTAVQRARPRVVDAMLQTGHYGLEEMPVPVVIVSGGYVRAFNRSFTSLLGMSEGRLSGLSLGDLWVVPEHGRFLERSLRTDQRGDGERSFEASWRRVDGTRIFVELRCRRVESFDAEDEGWMIVANDVSRHHRAREFLRIQRDLVECADTGIEIVDVSDPRHHKIVFVNPAWEKTLGYAAEEVIGRDPCMLHLGDDDQPGIAEIRGAALAGASVSTVLRNRRKDGTRFWCETTVFPLRSGDARHSQYVGIKRDVSDRVETLNQLAESERRFRHLFTDNRLPMFLVQERDDRIFDVNPAATAFYGFSRERLVSMCLAELSVAVEDGPTPGDLCVPEAGAERTLRHRTANGSVHDVVTYSGELQLADEPVRYVIVVDITARREAERQLRRAIQVAEAASSAKSDFLQVVGHEIRTPMNAIFGFSELLEGAEDDAERDDCIEQILEGSRNLMKVVDGVVELIGWSSDSVCGPDCEAEIGELMNAALIEHRPVALAKGLELRLDLVGFERHWVAVPFTDYMKMISIVVDNAIKFTREGRVVIEVRDDPVRQRFRVRVADTGIGIDSNLQDSIFEPFGSGDEGIQRKFGGIGLGLARVKRMADAYKAKVHFESVPGEGSSFVLDFPYRPA